jgi:tetratricopeptide (TPR) repeat protein
LPLIVLLALSCAASVWAQDEPERERGGPVQEQGLEILQRQPSEWPVSEAGAWSDWGPSQEPPEAARPLLATSIEAYRRSDLPGALTGLYQLLEELPGYPPAMHQAGVIYFRLRRYGDAVTALERYLAVAPDRIGDTRALGHCYYTLGDYEHARAHYLRVLELEPESVEALRGLGLAQMRLGESAAALVTLERVLGLEPTHANAQTWVAQILYDEERVEEALAAALKARDLDPFEPRAWFLLSQVYYDLGQDEDGDAAHARFSELNQLAQEIRAAEARLLYDPRQPAVYDNLIALNRRAGNDARAVHWMVRWIQADPRNIELRIRALDLASELGDAAGVTACAEALEGLAGESLVAWQRLAVYYASTRERLKQVAAEEQVARLRAKQ